VCEASSDLRDAVTAGISPAFNATTCTNANIRNAVSCFQCSSGFAPRTYSNSTRHIIEEGLTQFSAECKKRGFSVQSFLIMWSISGAALVRYEGSVKIASAVGVAAVVGLLAL